VTYAFARYFGLGRHCFNFNLSVYLHSTAPRRRHCEEHHILA